MYYLAGDALEARAGKSPCGNRLPYAAFMRPAGDSDGFRIEASRQGAARVLRLIGELDLSGVELFEQTLEAEWDAEGGIVALDLRDLTFMDSSGSGRW